MDNSKKYVLFCWCRHKGRPVHRQLLGLLGVVTYQSRCGKHLACHKEHIELTLRQLRWTPVRYWDIRRPSLWPTKLIGPNTVMHQRWTIVDLIQFIPMPVCSLDSRGRRSLLSLEAHGEESTRLLEIQWTQTQRPIAFDESCTTCVHACLFASFRRAKEYHVDTILGWGVRNDPMKTLISLLLYTPLKSNVRHCGNRENSFFSKW
jgi:hypothetical protein